MNNITNRHYIGRRFIFDPNDNGLIDTQENNEVIRLGSNENRALCLFIEEPGAIITREQLHNYVWREQGFEVDDSSLTQCISTLRKALKDCTKSPAFVKTVPKRGYRLVADVEIYHPEMSEQSSSMLSQEESSQTTPLVNHADVEEPAHSAVVKEKDSATTTAPSISTSRSFKTKIWNGIALLFAILLPILAYISTPIASTAFIPLFKVNHVQVLTPSTHPVSEKWNPTITECIHHYLLSDPDNHHLEQVIVTGGEHNQVWLNYINSNQADSSSTLRLVSTKGNVELCQ